MSWLQLIIPASAKQVERLSDALESVGAASVTLQDAADQPLLEPAPGSMPIWSETRVIGLFPADQDPGLLIERINPLLAEPVAEWKAEPLEDQNWVRSWMDHFQPMQFGRRLWIVPGGYTPPDPQAVNILLDPGLAFGTGTHPTTRLCLEWLDAHPPTDQDVIDYGCGSGILAIAARKLGARHLWGVDNDPQALLATAENLRKNGIEAGVSLHLPGALPPETTVPLLLANILAGPLISLAPQLASHVQPGGSIVLAGILDTQMDDVIAAYQPFFEMQLYRQIEEWVCLAGTKS
ncbi:50S ribosomal protein L11 methyltransferase [Thiohalophilus thiocyanatoxydans]|uniref:Ribosomal protein L11 methyltransferase n=1 Tax=Thiohalophilus thiocyanatoxydans TaxID=381308 RepID=A0A4R8IGB0_9GAMM|nr:50S ribosomal protein L11 methyltransferase [Thiohalophilus thiocyanatoxydans]TDX99591.1 ribosomal protein L11 methyltransferase [Thiohalophilus thiocyanatoxydans]